LQKERLKKLASRVDALAAKDESLLRRAREIMTLRREAALELHGICAGFVRAMNELLKLTELEFAPPEYSAGSFQENGVNLFQINARGRLLQISFQATPELISTENFRAPYILEGSVRCFNQPLLEQDLIEEQSIFCTLEKNRTLWRFFKARTYQSGPLDMDYLISLLEQLV
jgi:hypothetical protein